MSRRWHRRKAITLGFRARIRIRLKARVRVRVRLTIESTPPDNETGLQKIRELFFHLSSLRP